MPHNHPLATNRGDVPAHVLAAQLDLTAAWHRVEAKAGMPGVDGVTTRHFARDPHPQLRALEASLANSSYRPLPLRMAHTEKKNGSPRLLLIPAIIDRIALTAVSQWLNRRWEPLFDPWSYAYRPGRGVTQALRQLAIFRDEGYRWVLDADLRSFFDSIHHRTLLSQIERFAGEGSALVSWLSAWLPGPVWDGTRLGRLEKGVPQGSPLSPVLANIYLHPFDQALRRRQMRFVRFADDFLIAMRTPFDIERLRPVLQNELAALHLHLHPEKTRTTCFDRHFRFLGAEMQGDRILVPFDKKKSVRAPIATSARMPQALLQAYRTGHLNATQTFHWEPPAAAPNAATPAPTRRQSLLAALAGRRIA